MGGSLPQRCLPDILFVVISIAWLATWLLCALGVPWLSCGYGSSLDVTARLVCLVSFAAHYSLSLQLQALVGDEGILPLSETLVQLQLSAQPPPPAHLARMSPSDRALHWTARATTRVVAWVLGPGCRSPSSGSPRPVHEPTSVSCVPSPSEAGLWATALAQLGAGLSFLAACVPGPAGPPMALLLAPPTLIYYALKRSCGPFLALQWDQLLLEASCTCCIVTTLLPLATSHRHTALLAIPMQLLAFRLMFGAGWVKLASGDKTWRDLTAMAYHLHTQPLPTWLAYQLHRALPLVAHKASTATALAIELLAPLLMLCPPSWRLVRLTCWALLAALQGAIAATGHYGFFNVLSAVVCTPVLPDSIVEAFLPQLFRSNANSATVWWWYLRGVPLPSLPHAVSVCMVCAASLALTLISLVAIAKVLSRYEGGTVVCGWVSAREHWPGQLHTLGGIVMHLGGHYGLFARMTRCRDEVVIEVLHHTHDTHTLDTHAHTRTHTTLEEEEEEEEAVLLELPERHAHAHTQGRRGRSDGDWREIAFRYKPGPVTRPMVWVPPMHMPRVDWRAWFLPLSPWGPATSGYSPWLLALLRQILRGSPPVHALFEGLNPHPPHSDIHKVRVWVYRYKFAYGMEDVMLDDDDEDDEDHDDRLSGREEEEDEARELTGNLPPSSDQLSQLVSSCDGSIANIGRPDMHTRRRVYWRRELLGEMVSPMDLKACDAAIATATRGLGEGGLSSPSVSMSSKARALEALRTVMLRRRQIRRDHSTTTTNSTRDSHQD